MIASTQRGRFSLCIACRGVYKGPEVILSAFYRESTEGRSVIGSIHADCVDDAAQLARVSSVIVDIADYAALRRAGAQSQ